MPRRDAPTRERDGGVLKRGIRSVRGVVESYTDNERATRALDAWRASSFNGAQTTIPTTASISTLTDMPVQPSNVTREWLWIRAPALIRYEMLTGEGGQVIEISGAEYSSTLGAWPAPLGMRTSVDLEQPYYRYPDRDALRALLDPPVLLAGYRLQLFDEGKVVDRAVTWFRGVRSLQEDNEPVILPEAETVQFAIDKTYGLVLAWLGLHQGAAFSINRFTTVSLNDVESDDIFTSKYRSQLVGQDLQ